jgi:hypothetical protein
VTALAGAVADSFEKWADLLHEMAGTRLGESTVERSAEDAGARAAQDQQAGRTYGPRVVWPWHKDYRGRRCAYVELDATGVRQQGDGGGAAEGRMAYVGLVCNPAPDWPWPDDQQGPLRARYVAGLYALEEMGPLLRRQAAQVGMGQADCWLGLTDGGNGLEGRLEENFPLLLVVILDFFHPAEKLTGLARLLFPKDEARAEAQARDWCRLLEDEGGGAAECGAAGVGLAAACRPGRSGGRPGGLPGAAGASHGVPRVPGGGLVHWQRGGGECLQDRGGPAPQAGGHALGRRRRGRPVPSARSLPQREGPVGGLLEPRLHPQLIACPTN